MQVWHRGLAQMLQSTAMQRLLDSYKTLLLSISENTRRLSKRSRILRYIISIALVIGLTLLCGLATNIRVVLAVWSWILLCIVPILFGTYLIFVKYGANHPKTGVVLFAALIGLITLFLALSGMLYDEKVISHGWGWAFITGLQMAGLMFIGVLLVALALSWLRSSSK